ncbi:NACHT domain-containing protein [Streptomyces sp. TRM S81-3]|uniref:NACHT domain-containing protein n=1 Tax=Streptomyces griseicoloratus TaxID=2752516 RepID=A0A926L9D7_9ACTN|nr:NACHT domain-containing protein [Streptomyces griseicoloratus]MBD0422478.1 NACHT domain-containing protein [Streptomyces griseicoloratus]
MEPAVLGGKLASGLVAPLVKKLFVTGGPGAGLVDRPVRLARLVSFRGERRHLGEAEVRKLAGRLVGASLDSPGEPPFPPGEADAVTDGLTARLLALGDLDMDDVQAVGLGYRELARRLRDGARRSDDGLSTDARYFLDSATEWACLHILEFFTRRSTFVARTLVEQTRGQAELIAKVDELITRTPRPDARDTAFERRYLPYVAEQHDRITIYGIDLRDSPDRWPLEVAYLSLEATTGEDRSALPEERPEPDRTVRVPAEDAFRTHDRVLLRGDAGSGKTTLVQWLAVTAARDGDRVPYVLPLRTLVRAGALPAPAAFLTAVGCPLTPPEGWAERVLTAGRGLLLVDGLDEIPSADRHRTRDWLLALIRAFPGNRWLLTSRPTAVRPDWLAAEGFHELALTPMRQADVAAFVQRWHAAARAPEYEARLLDSLRTKRDLARLATNPLMCGLMCALHRERRGYLPTGRKELYDAALTMLLARRDRERGMGAVDGAELGEEAQVELLQRLAYALVLSGRTEMDVATAEGIVERCLPSVASAAGQGDAATVLGALLLRSGLLRRPAEGVLEFVHRTFQDYLGARYAVEEGHLDVLAGHAHDTQWEDVIRMAVAHARPGERAVLLRRLLADGTARLTLLALACLEHATALDPAVRAEVEARAAALIPPRSKEDAKLLAEAGPLVLELLPGPEGLTDTEAHGVTVTASLLATLEPDGAMAVLRRFREHADLDVRRQLVGTWARFEGRAYATEVLDHLDRTDLTLTCASDAQRLAVAGMRPWSRLEFRGGHRLSDIVSAVPDPAAVEVLRLVHNPAVAGLGALSAFGSLRRLVLIECPSARGFEELAPLPLGELVIAQAGDLAGLRELGSLRLLSLSGPLPGDRLTDVLPVPAPLEYLFLGRRTTDHTGLRGLSHWRTLKVLSLAPTATLTAADWAEIARLPLLGCLHLSARLFPFGLGPMPALPGINELRLAGFQGGEDVSGLPARLPGVRVVRVLSAPGARVDTARFEALFPDAEVSEGEG